MRAGRRALPLPSLALGWTDTTRLDLRFDAGRLLVTAVPDGPYGLAGRGRLPLPVHLRRGCGIEPGDRVLLAGEPADGVVTIHPLASLDAMLTTAADLTPISDAA